MVPSTMGIGRMINNKGMERKSGKMELYIEGIIFKGRSKGKGFLSGVTTACMKEIFGKIIFMEKENIHGKMAKYMTGSGKTTKWMGKVFLLGLTVGNTMESI